MKKCFLVALVLLPIAPLIIGLWLAPTRLLNALTPVDHIDIDKNIFLSRA